jgi:hypothetical protein
MNSSGPTRPGDPGRPTPTPRPGTRPCAGVGRSFDWVAGHAARRVCSAAARPGFVWGGRAPRARSCVAMAFVRACAQGCRARRASGSFGCGAARVRLVWTRASGSFVRCAGVGRACAQGCRARRASGSFGCGVAGVRLGWPCASSSFVRTVHAPCRAPVRSAAMRRGFRRPDPIGRGRAHAPHLRDHGALLSWDAHGNRGPTAAHVPSVADHRNFFKTTPDPAQSRGRR